MTTGLDTIDRTVQETNLWLKSLMTRLGTDDRHLSYLILRATLHALRDRLRPATAADLGAQLPMLLRGLYYEGWRMTETPTKERHVGEFLDHVRAELPARSADDAARAVRAVFDVIWEKVEPGEVAKVIRFLPEEIRDLWPRVARED